MSWKVHPKTFLLKYTKSYSRQSLKNFFPFHGYLCPALQMSDHLEYRYATLMLFVNESDVSQADSIPLSAQSFCTLGQSGFSPLERLVSSLRLQRPLRSSWVVSVQRSLILSLPAADNSSTTISTDAL